jgi:hypothetical protein
VSLHPSNLLSRALPDLGPAPSEIVRMAEPFRVASLDLLADRVLTVRSDWKFVLPQASLPKLLRSLSKTHLVLMAGEARWGRYSSQYYDTPDLICFQDHRRGKPRRFKVRHRDYLDRHLTMLEIKDRVPRGDTHKRRLPQMWRQRVVDVAGAAFLSEGGHVPVDALVPTLANRFWRLTLLGEKVHERLTVDLGIGVGLDGRIGELAGVCVLEVKSAEPRHKTPTLALLARTGMRPRGMSKYCVGTCLLTPGASPAWFAPLRRTLGKLSASSTSNHILER